jgi:hypothetical protein
VKTRISSSSPEKNKKQLGRPTGGIEAPSVQKAQLLKTSPISLPYPHSNAQSSSPAESILCNGAFQPVCSELRKHYGFLLYAEYILSGTEISPRPFFCRKCWKKPVSEIYERALVSHCHPQLYLKRRYRKEEFYEGFVESPVMTTRSFVSLPWKGLFCPHRGSFQLPVSGLQAQQEVQIWR